MSAGSSQGRDGHRPRVALTAQLLTQCRSGSPHGHPGEEGAAGPGGDGEVSPGRGDDGE